MLWYEGFFGLLMWSNILKIINIEKNILHYTVKRYTSVAVRNN